jgi:hypothetical protein
VNWKDGLSISWVVGYGLITLLGAILLFVSAMWVEGIVACALASAIFGCAVYIRRRA